MPVTLYKRQKQIYDFISQYIQKFGCSPTLQQIADAINVHSLATIHEHLQAMVKKGVIRKYEGTIRGIELIDKKMGELTKGIEVPILGYIAAGAPIEPFTDPNATLQVSASMLSGGKSSFVLQVKGESMIEDGILPDDYVVVEQQEVANNGDIVVALINNEATVKRYFRGKGHVELRPAHTGMESIRVKQGDLRIQGKVVGVMRYL